MVVDNFGKGKTDFAPGVAGSHMPAGHHTEPDKEAALGRKVGAAARLAFDNPLEFGAQHIVLEPVELRRSGWKVGLVGLGMDLPAQKDVLAGCQVALEQPRVVLAEQMVEQAGQLVDLAVGQSGQMDY